jgi:phosphate acetyltransferase
MNKAIYLTTIEPKSGKSLVSVGLMHELLGKTSKVAYFRPVIDDLPEGEKDNHIETALKHFHLSTQYEEAYGLKMSEVIAMKNEGKDADVMETIIKKYKVLEKRCDLILIEGSDFTGNEGSTIEFSLNVDIASNLSVPVILVGSGIGKTLDEFMNSMRLAYDSFKEREVEVISIIANKIQRKNTKLVIKALKSVFPANMQITAIPRETQLLNPNVREIVEYFKANVIAGSDFLDKNIKQVIVGAMQLRHFLPTIKDKSLIIAPGDRADIILGALQANRSANYPNISGIVLSGGLKPEKPVLKLLEGIDPKVPIFSVQENTYEVAGIISSFHSKIQANDTRKILESIQLFKKYAPVDDILNHLVQFESDHLSPSMFLYNLLEKAKRVKKRIVLPEGNDPRILKAACRIQAQDLVELILLGEENQIRSLLQNHNINLNISKLKIINPLTDASIGKYAEMLYQLRKHKGLTLPVAEDLVSDVSYFGTMMIYAQDADGMVSGAAHTTQHTIRPALQIIKTKPMSKIVSSVFFMCLPNRVSAFADCAINVNPSAEELAEIAMVTADSAQAFGIDAKVAMLSYSSGSSGKGEDVEKVRTATEIVKRQRPDLKVEGPIQYDAAVDMNVGKSKMPDSEVAGQANVLIFPDLNTGNNTYKAVQRETGALAVGPMLQGLNKPVNDLSRGCTVEDIYNTILLTAIQAQE